MTGYNWGSLLLHWCSETCETVVLSRLATPTLSLTGTRLSYTCFTLGTAHAMVSHARCHFHLRWKRINVWNHPLLARGCLTIHYVWQQAKLAWTHGPWWFRNMWKFEIFHVMLFSFLSCFAISLYRWVDRFPDYQSWRILSVIYKALQSNPNQTSRLFFFCQTATWIKTGQWLMLSEGL